MAKAFQRDTNGTLRTSLVSWYSLKNDGNDFYGTQNGTSSNVTYSGSDAAFNGSSSKIDLPTNATNGFNPGSWAFWMKTSDTTDEVLMQFDNAGDTNNIYFRKNFTTANKLDFITYNGTSDTKITSATSVTTDAWIHVVVTYTGTTANMYINGNTTADATNGSMHNITAGSDRRGIGYFRLANILYYTGSLKLFGIWDKVLSNQEIIDLYNGGVDNNMVYYNDLQLLGVGRY